MFHEERAGTRSKQINRLATAQRPLMALTGRLTGRPGARQASSDQQAPPSHWISLLLLLATLVAVPQTAKAANSAPDQAGRARLEIMAPAGAEGRRQMGKVSSCFAHWCAHSA